MKTELQTQDRTFKKSSYSVGSPSGMRCVGVSLSEKNIMVKNVSKPDSAILAFTADEWRAFVAGVKNGEFDLPT